jgi:tripartite-type tricarboxylate transporter receptor subunit TctC
MLNSGVPHVNRPALCAAVLALLVLTTFAPALAQKVDFAGQRVDVVVPTSPGGSLDVYIRTLAPFLEKHLPGKPAVVVRNMPGAGGIAASNQFQQRAKPDGLNAIGVTSSVVASFVFQRSKVQFDLDRWQPVLLSPQGAVIYVSSTLGVRGPQDIAKLKGQKLVFGGQAATGGPARTIVALELLGVRPTYVWGLSGGPVRLAFERGEFNINYDTTPSYVKSVTRLVETGRAVPLFSLGIFDAKGNVVRDPNFPELPTFVEAYELVHGKKPSGPEFEAWKTLTQMGVMFNKAIMLPAETPRHIVDAWRTAVRNILQDPEFRRTAAAVIEGYPQFIGEEARPVIREATTLSPETWEWLRSYYRTHHNLAL